ncbi:hypothetical protein AQUCO_03200073v1 [Aquilegia coerulea]|uniref:Uncharacterized protein n=1 Tax=Aquilegia coerulea TaxID=218851 RepID=A0A2G5D014_AQUCA|nr:hypothetical protein AQUCO_03200073v1 [Aquilegia coerulea]
MANQGVNLPVLFHTNPSDYKDKKNPPGFLCGCYNNLSSQTRYFSFGILNLAYRYNPSDYKDKKKPHE